MRSAALSAEYSTCLRRPVTISEQHKYGSLSQSNQKKEENRILSPAGVRAIHGADAPGMPAVLEEGKILAPLLLLRSADAQQEVLSAAALCRSPSAASSSKRQ